MKTGSACVSTVGNKIPEHTKKKDDEGCIYFFPKSDTFPLSFYHLSKTFNLYIEHTDVTVFFLILNYYYSQKYDYNFRIIRALSVMSFENSMWFD